MPGPFRQPVISGGHNGEHSTGNKHIVEVRHHKVGIMVLEIHRRNGQHQAGETAQGKEHDKGDSKHHGRFKTDGAAPHGCHPVEHLDPGRHGYQHGGVHKEELTSERHAGGKHMVRPYDERQQGDGRGGIHHGGVAKQFFAREGGHYGGDNTKCRQDHYVHLGVTEEPENMLEHHGIATTGGIKEIGAEVFVRQYHGHRPGQHRHYRNQQEGGDKPGPHKQRQFHPLHARRAHVDDSHYDVNGTHNGADPHDMDGKYKQRCVVVTVSGRQRRVEGPTKCRAASFHKQGG